MQKMTVRGIPLHVDDRRIVLLEGGAVCTYNRDYYRLPFERDEVRLVGVEMETEGHGFLRPIYEGR